ncbi:MAG: hypothetical protein JXK05_13860 [Campylobacterales bacterium]|nr:hypothetical protein [Campylobacterales bacterium]
MNNIAEIYAMLISNQNINPYEFLDQIIHNEKHIFWGVARDVAAEKLMLCSQWRWLGLRIDDVGFLVEEEMWLRFPYWIRRAELGKGSLTRHMQNTHSLVLWIFERYISTLKNLFDPRYRFYLSLPKLTSYSEQRLCYE